MTPRRLNAFLLTVGTTPVEVLLSTPYPLNLGMKIRSLTSNAGNVFLGVTSALTIGTGILVPKGDPGKTYPRVIPANHFDQLHPTGGIPEATGVEYPEGFNQVWLVADTPAQVVEIEAA